MLVMSFFKSLSPSHRAQRQEAQSLAERIVYKEIIVQAGRGARRSGAKVDQETWQFREAVYSNTKEKGAGWTVIISVDMPTPFKFKSSYEGELTLAMAQYKQKNARKKFLDRITVPEVRVDAYSMFFDIFLSYPD